MKKLWLLLLLVVCGTALADDFGTVSWDDTLGLTVCLVDTTFKTISEPDSIRIFWGYFDGTNATVKKDSVKIDSTQTQYRTGKGSYVYRLPANIYGSGVSAYSSHKYCWAEARVYRWGKSGIKSWSWKIGSSGDYQDRVMFDDYVRDRDAEENPVVIDEGVLIDQVEDTTGWTKSGTGATWDKISNDIYVKRGKYSVKLSSVNGVAAVMEKTLTAKSQAHNVFTFWVYNKVPIRGYTFGGDENLDYIEFRVTGDVSGWDNYFYKQFKDSTVLPHWNQFVVPREGMAAVGSPTWLKKVRRIAFVVKADASENVDAYFDEVRVNPKQRAKCIMRFDDANRTVYTLAYPIMKDNFQRGTVAAVCSSIVAAEATAFTVGMLDTLYADGWDIINHGWGHLELEGAGDSIIREDLNRCNSWIKSHGWTRGGDFHAWAYNSLDSTSVNVAKEYYTWVTGGRPYSVYQNHLDVVAEVGQERMYVSPANYVVMPATVMAKGWIDTTIMNGNLMILNFHSFTTGAGSGQDLNIDSFKVISNYLYQKRAEIDVVTESDYYRAQKMVSQSLYDVKNELSDLRRFFGACDSCYMRYFPDDGSPNKDSVMVIDRSREGADTILAVLKINHKQSASDNIMDTSYYYDKRKKR